MKVVTLSAEPREDTGSAVARRFRRAGRLPGIIYGEGVEPRSVTLTMRDFSRALEDGARVLDLVMEGVGEARVLLKDVQWDALGRRLLHADFLRLSPDKEIELAVPVDFVGVPKGLSAGGIVAVTSNYITLRCLPTNIPEKVVVTMTELGLGESLYARDVELPENVALAVDPDSVVVTCAAPRGTEDDDEDEGDDEASVEVAS